MKAMRGRNYRQALHKLKRLVVQRLLELTKLNLSGVGYKQRKKISQALRACTKAIQKALDTYNEAALAMVPPQQTLEWNDILEMATLADFDLLKDTDLDLTLVPCAQPGHRECISRLVTFMLDEHADYYHAMIRARNKNQHDLASELEHRLQVNSEINGHIAIWLVLASELEGFSGAAEKKWLRLRGFKGTHREALIARRKATRAETLASYNRMLRDVTNEIDKLRMRVHKYESHFVRPENTPGNPQYRLSRVKAFDRLKKQSEEQLAAAEKDSKWMEEVVSCLGSQTGPETNTRPRHLSRPSPELLAVIQRKVEIAYPNQ
ncbi:hypothetical protein AAF712_015634 [Marasmius tenuissimus]|uniref:Uncharacterized protein n=1 Tax=Marasmius tenuissimus TaxID=585030 RepID=A0ABR2Z9X8_9AGAR